MKAPLKVHWSSSKPNFGDWLSPLVCEMLSRRRVQLAPIGRCDLVAAGSLFDRLPEHWLARRLDVWGTGSIAESARRRSRHRYHALRGPLTAGLLESPTVTTFGDPGLLAPELLPDRPVQKRFRVGLVPHYKDAGRDSVVELGASLCGATLIDVFEPPVDVIRRIAACHCIVSSSLHGLIVADALGVPALWLVASQSVRGHGWKFRDHYAAVGVDAPRSYSPAEIAGRSADELLALAPAPRVEPCRQGLLESFPYAA